MVPIICPAAESGKNQRFRQVERDTFQHFIQEHETAVFTYCYRMLGNTRLAESVAELAFLDVHSHFPHIAQIHVLAAARDRCQKQLNHGDFSLDAPVTHIQFLFNNLPVSEREAVALRYGCKLNFDEIATILDTTCENVRAILRQGRWQIARLEEMWSAQNQNLRSF